VLGLSYVWTIAEIVSLSRSKIDFAELEITNTRIRKAKTGAILMEIPGEESGTKANVLSERLRTAEHENRVSMIRPVRRSDFWTSSNLST